MQSEGLLSQTFVQVASGLVNDTDVVEFLTMLSTRAVDLLSVDAAGIVLVDPSGKLRVVASSSEAAQVIELFEVQNDEGPCLESCGLAQLVPSSNRYAQSP